ncbi:MAG TPA: hypothetical protein DCE56_02210 [Cyanobacteria bacterium UBA8553]|nr:hypothetical protein [Cyanobacteria bacterium UBA8553]
MTFSTDSSDSQFSWLDFYDEDEINGVYKDDSLNNLDEAAPGWDVPDVDDSFSDELSLNNPVSLDNEDLIDFGLVLPDDFPVPSEQQLQAKADFETLLELENSVEIPDF